MDVKPWHRHYDYNVPTTIRYPKLTAYEILNIPASNFPDKAATIFFGTEITFYELRNQVLRLANALGTLGVKKGDRIGIHLPTCPQYIISYYATIALGAIAVNLNPMYTPTELKALVSNTGITTLFTFDMVLPNIRALCQDVEIQRVIVTRLTDYVAGSKISTTDELELEEGWHHFSSLLESSSNTKLPMVKIMQDDPALIQFTGGTTGLPKGAVLTHANLVAATMQVSLWSNPLLVLTPPEKRNVLGILPYFHVYGTIVSQSWAIFNCATQILVPRFEIDELMELLSKSKRITFMPAVPTMINAILNHPRASRMELSKKLGFMNSGGGPMPVELIKQAMDMGIFFSEGWGMSETTSLGIGSPVMGLKKAGSIGVPFPDMDVRIVDIEGGITEKPPGEPGELIIRGPVIMKEFWNDPEETAVHIKNGWLYTGDIAVWDEDDYISIVDRKKDMVISGGYNIYPREIDEVLFQHPKIMGAVAVGIFDEYRGETIKAFVVLKEGQIASENEIISYCKKKLAPYKIPKFIEFRKELPASAIGKILRKRLRDEEAAKIKKNNNETKWS